MPELTIDHCGPLAKNVPVLAVLLLLWLAQPGCACALAGSRPEGMRGDRHTAGHTTRRRCTPRTPERRSTRLLRWGGMQTFNLLLLAGGLLVFTSLLAGVLSARLGLPFLLVFLVAGMLAGVDGPLGVSFDSVPLAAAVGNKALA